MLTFASKSSGILYASQKTVTEKIRSHPALSHQFLKRFSQGGLSLHQIRTFGLQHYQLVRVFTTYMTNLVARRPEWRPALRDVFDDEFGQYTIFRSHVHLYRDFLKALGLEDADWGKVEWAVETKSFIYGHLDLTREGDILAALGAIGPGHEFSIPVMFGYLVEGLRLSGLKDGQIEYFTEHIAQDQRHIDAFNGLIASSAPDTVELERVHAGALFSLDLRSRFWSGLGRLVFRGN